MEDKTRGGQTRDSPDNIHESRTVKKKEIQIKNQNRRTWKTRQEEDKQEAPRTIYVKARL